MMNANNFAYFIASYNKADNISTYKYLQKLDVKYPIFIVVGLDDPQLEEYIKLDSPVLVYDKDDYKDKLDKIGKYRISNKICTYSRLAIDDFAKQLNIRYVGYMFDDILSMALRYEKNGKIAGISVFNLDEIIDLYIEILNSSDKIYMVGPPQSSFYIGVSTDKINKYSARFGNMFVYDRYKKLEPYMASTIEDMSMVIANNTLGKLSICPFGLQINCRDPKVTDDSYGNMQVSEYYQQWSIVFRTCIDINKPQLPYKSFIPKIIDPIYKKGKNDNAFIFGTKKDRQ